MKTLIKPIIITSNYYYKNFNQLLFSTIRRSYYDILQLPPNASQQQIKNNYHQLAKQYHPDKNSSYTERFKLISQAYNTLKDPNKRKKYDQSHHFYYKKDKTTDQNNKNDTYQDMYGFSKTYNSGKNYHYGYQYRGKQNLNNEKSFKDYGNSYTYHPNKNYNFGNSQFDYQYWMNQKKKQQQFDKNVNNMDYMQKSKMSSPNSVSQQIKKAFAVGIGLAFIVIIAEIIIKVYQFNSLYRRRSYYQKLDPNQSL